MKVTLKADFYTNRSHYSSVKFFNVENIIASSESMSTAKLKKEVLKHLAEKPFSLAELAEKMQLKEKRIFRLLRSLFEGGEIASMRDSDGSRKYRLTTEEEKEKHQEESEVEEVNDDEED